MKNKPNANSLFYISGKGNTTWTEIETAVNSHEDLVKALNVVLSSGIIPNTRQDLRMEVTEAIAKAGVK